MTHMQVTKKPKIAILSLRNNYTLGGVFSCLRVVYRFCEQYFQPTVFFLGFDADVATSLRSCKFSSSAKEQIFFGMRSVQIGARWAFWEPGHYAFNKHVWERELAGYDYFFVVSGTCIVAHPLVLLNKKFISWICTTYDDDRAQRVQQLSGLRRLIDMCSQKKMRLIERSILYNSSVILPMSVYARDSFNTIVPDRAGLSIQCGYPLEMVSVPVSKIASVVPIILAVGRFSDPRKNIDMLMRVFQGLYEKIGACRLIVVGHRPPDESMAQYAHLSSYDHILFTGQVSATDLNSMYASARVMLITSYQEGLGIVGLEAMLRGVPVVATNCGGTKDFVIPGQTGYLVDINDDQDMIDKTLKILRDDALHAAMSAQAIELVRSSYSTAIAYKKFKMALAATYPELLAVFDQQEHADNDVILPSEKSVDQVNAI